VVPVASCVVSVERRCSGGRSRAIMVIAGYGGMKRAVEREISKFACVAQSRTLSVLVGLKQTRFQLQSPPPLIQQVAKATRSKRVLNTIKRIIS